MIPRFGQQFSPAPEGFKQILRIVPISCPAPKARYALCTYLMYLHIYNLAIHTPTKFDAIIKFEPGVSDS